jgi:replication-associated recombination protein RarA
MEPGEELRRLESAILGEDESLRLEQLEPAGPAAVAPVVAPRQLPADIVDFTGRESLVAQAEAVLRTADPDSPVPVVVIAGKAGIGKTALAVHWAHQVADRFLMASSTSTSADLTRAARQWIQPR